MEIINVKEKTLREVIISKDDVTFLANEFEVGTDVAERALRLHGGNFDKTLNALLGMDKETNETTTKV